VDALAANLVVPSSFGVKTLESLYANVYMEYLADNGLLQAKAGNTKEDQSSFFSNLFGSSYPADDWATLMDTVNTTLRDQETSWLQSVKAEPGVNDKADDIKTVLDFVDNAECQVLKTALSGSIDITC